jgi:prephenate dehydratase
MALKVQKVDTWKAMLRDKPGELAAKLSALAKAGINLEFVIARRSPEKPGTGVVFVTPIEGAVKGRAAQLNGFQRTKSMHTVRIEGTDR